MKEERGWGGWAGIWAGEGSGQNGGRQRAGGREEAIKESRREPAHVAQVVKRPVRGRELEVDEHELPVSGDEKVLPGGMPRPQFIVCLWCRLM